MVIKITKRVNIEIGIEIEREKSFPTDNKKEIEARRKVFSGEGFKL